MLVIWEKFILKLLDQSSKYNLISFYDPDVTNGQRIEKEFDYKYFKQLDQLIDSVDV